MAGTTERVSRWRGCRATGERAATERTRTACILESAILREQERFAELDLTEALAALAASAPRGMALRHRLGAGGAG